MRVDNVPSEMLDEAVREQLFGLHRPYAMPTAGYADDVKKLGVGDLTAFYRRFYAPNNAVLIVAGDTTAEAVRKLAEKYYGPIPSRPVEPRAAAGRGRHRPAAARDPRRCAGRRAALEPRFPRAVLSRRRDAARPCAAGAGAAVRRQRDQPPVARAGGEDKLALSATAGYGATSLGLTSFEIAVQPARGAQRRGDRDGGRRPDEEGARRRRHGRRGRAGAEPAAGERDLFAGFAGERPASLRLALCAPAARIAEIDAWPQAHRRGSAGRCRGRRAPCLARRRRGHVAAHAGRGQEMSGVCAGIALALGSRWSPRVPKPSRSRKSPRRSASRPGWSRTRARRSWRCPSPSPAAAPAIPRPRRA